MILQHWETRYSLSLYQSKYGIKSKIESLPFPSDSDSDSMYLETGYSTPVTGAWGQGEGRLKEHSEHASKKRSFHIPLPVVLSEHCHLSCLHHHPLQRKTHKLSPAWKLPCPLVRETHKGWLNHPQTVGLIPTPAPKYSLQGTVAPALLWSAKPR